VEISKVVLSPVVQNLHTTNPVLTDTDERSNVATATGFVNRFGMLKRQRMVGYLNKFILLNCISLILILC
jgi:hypothetical protein